MVGQFSENQGVKSEKIVFFRKSVKILGFIEVGQKYKLILYEREFYQEFNAFYCFC